MRVWVLLLLACLCCVASCRNAPAVEREQMRRDVETVKPEDRQALRARLRLTLLGDGPTRPEVDPHLRASAAQGLGNLANPEDSDALLEGLSGPLADENLQVRMECAIGLGKLVYGSENAEQRKAVLRRLRDRLGFDRDEAGRLYEREYFVRLAMLNSMIQIGGRTAAFSVHDVASRLVVDLEGAQAGANADASDKGLLERALEGLRQLTGATVAEAAANRRLSDDLEPHMKWWAQRVSQLPEG
ncbi:MAG: hypothetical protein IPP14_10265 [Planctomycetes bacterium]|nr:hypothetical protein [Planctomycetota bacterium]